MYRLEIELPPKDGQGASVETKTTKGNKGYLTGSKTTKEKAEYMTKKSNGRVILEPMKPRVIYQEVASPVSSPAKKDKAVEKSTRTYVVQKGDTLQKISDKVYGTTKNWKKIFNANKKTLKDPNKIKLGQKLIIPEL
ncbi:MAG: LysM peptidoglycan-binding domain-containing protein [Candidatus Omnitrophica bacterium]|nr:LysM peptidoglycan-binding domain-containing protein [Candidatus Omnitrophota bacterium]